MEIVDRFKFITPNGEIVYDHRNMMFKVYDETYSEVICETPYESIARKAYEMYGKILEGRE